MKYVMTAAVFDLCHKGHLNILREMRKEAGSDGKVIVFLHDDKSIYETKGKIPIQSYSKRKQNMFITGLVNQVVLVKDYTSLSMKIKNFHEENKGNDFIWIRGDDWADFPARQTVEELNIEIKLVPYTKGISSTKIRKGLEKL